MLRTPSTDRAEYERRRRLIDFAEGDERERQEAQFVLACLGRFRRADVCRAFSPEEGGMFMFVVYIIMALALLLSPLSLIFWGLKGLLLTFALFVLNVMTHEWTARKCQMQIDTVNFSVSMAFALKKAQEPGL